MFCFVQHWPCDTISNLPLVWPPVVFKPGPPSLANSEFEPVSELKTHFTRNHHNHDDVEVLEYKAIESEELVHEDYSHLQSVLNKLDPSDRELIILNRFKEIRYEELAEIVGSTPGAVKTRVCRVLKKVKQMYLETI